MAKKEKIWRKQLETLVTEFRELLMLSLHQCASGRWGLFGAYDGFQEIKQSLDWHEAERLRELAFSIRSMQAESGEQDQLVEEFLRLCKFHRPNDPGEPKLAKAFLERIESRDIGSREQ